MHKFSTCRYTASLINKYFNNCVGMFVKHNCSKAFEIVKNNQALNFYAPLKIKLLFK